MPSDNQIASSQILDKNNSTVLEIPASSPASSTLTNDYDSKQRIASCFIAPSWHLPYAEALLEPVLPFLPTFITMAERAILTRYFELHEITEPLDERRDLWRAVEELRKLRKKLAKT